MAYFRPQNPWHIVEPNTEKLRSGLLIHLIISDRDAHKIPHTYRQLPNISHNPNLVLDDWLFYQQALSHSGAE